MKVTIIKIIKMISVIHMASTSSYEFRRHSLTTAVQQLFAFTSNYLRQKAFILPLSINVKPFGTEKVMFITFA